ncbi:hypothetical protein FS749_005488 [Ceratobasidium sp. UAMH 11750]|nr:hypothetical protein FS749_005488 [Ceratobasidium sp. UAMH 11750]
MEPTILTSTSPPDPRSVVLSSPPTPYAKMPSLRALESLRDSHIVPMSPRLEISQPPTPGPGHGHDVDDERREARADGDNPFPIDRAVLRQIVREKLGCEPTHIKFLSSGTFHKAFLVSLVDGPDVVARIARRYMPKLKTESEIATINYIRTHTKIPVPFIYAYDSDPYNKLGGEYIIMSKAPGVPLIRHFHSMSPATLQALTTNLANLLIPLSTQTFPAIGSLYQTSELCPPRDVVRSMLRRAKMGIDPSAGTGGGGLQLPRTHPLRPSPLHESATLPSPTPPPASPSAWSIPTTPAPGTYTAPKTSDFYVGPIVAWPFFGSGRGELPSVNRPFVPLSPSTPTSSLPPSSQLHHSRPGSPPNLLHFAPAPSSPVDQDPDEVDRGPFKSFGSYARACARREVAGVRREQEKAGAAHKPHMIPASEEHHGHHHGHGHHGHARRGHDLHMLHPPSRVRKKRARSGLGALGSDGRGPGRRVKSGLGSLGNGDGPIPSLSTSTSTSSDSDSDSDSDASSCSCSDSSCSCSSSPEEDVVSDEEQFYRDYRNAQRSSLFVGLNFAREGAVRAEMDRWVTWMSGMGGVGRIDEEEEGEESDADRPTGFAGIGSGGFVGVGNGAPLVSKPIPGKLANSTSPPRGVGVGGGGFVGVGPASTSVVLPPRARGVGVGAGGFVGVGPASSPSPAPPAPIPILRGVGVGGGGFVGVGHSVVPPPVNTRSGTGFVGVGVGSALDGIPSPPSPSSSEDSPSGFGRGFGGGVGVGGGGFLSVAAPVSPPKPKAPIRGLGVGGGGFVSLGHAQEEKKEKEKKKREVVEEKDELGDFVLDLHDLSLANIFVDPVDSSKITCIIDWESTTIRPFWQAAHLPTFLVSATHAHSHPVTPRMQSRPSYSHRPSHPDSRSSHRALGGLEAHLPPNGATSGMASIAALTAALNDYAQGIYDEPSPRFGQFESPRFDSPRVGAFGDSPRYGHHDSPRHTHHDSPGNEMDGDVDSPGGSAPRTAVLSVRPGHSVHSYSYPSPRRKSSANTAVNSIRPKGMSRAGSHRVDVHAHFGEEQEREHEHEHEGRAFRGRERTREEAAEHFKRVAAEIRCTGDGKRERETCGERWVRAERERAAWRVAHKAVEWDGWELGLVESVLEDARTLVGDMDF